MPKILYIGNFTRLWHEEMIAKCLEELGYEIIRAQERRDNVEDIQELLKKNKVEFVLMAKMNIGGHRERFIRWCKHNRIKTVCWVFDPYWGYIREDRISSEPHFKCDYVFTTDGGHDEKWKEAGINHQLLRQGIYREWNYMAETKEYKHDVIFVGTFNSHYHYRQQLCQFLKDNYDFHWYGRDNADEIRGHKLNELYANSKIVMGDSIPLKNYWSNRIYEVLGRGGFLIHPKVGGLDKEFTPYEHYIPYNRGNLKQLRTIIDYYLAHPRDQIRKAGFEQSKKYTYLERCKKLLKSVSRTPQ